jgi:transcriptional regulator with XRE-family HTH domain
MTGQDIRRYRRQLGMDQDAFSKRIGLTQSGLSLLETGKTSVSEDHIGRLVAAFDDEDSQPRISQFMQVLEKERAEEQAALEAPGGQHLTLTVWDWEGGLDLSRAPTPDRAVGLVTIAGRPGRMIALRMDKNTNAWQKGEILVFEECGLDAVRDDDICLVQRVSRVNKPKPTAIAVAHVFRATHGQRLQIEPLSPTGPIFDGDESVLAVLRVVYRAQYVN